jgi:hypothetical protein
MFHRWLKWDPASRGDTQMGFIRRGDGNGNRNTHKGLGGNEKLPPRRILMVGIVRKVQSTRTQLSHKHHHHGGAVCPSYGVLTMDTPDRTRVTPSEGVGQERFSFLVYSKTIKQPLY